MRKKISFILTALGERENSPSKKSNVFENHEGVDL